MGLAQVINDFLVGLFDFRLTIMQSRAVSDVVAQTFNGISESLCYFVKICAANFIKLDRHRKHLDSTQVRGLSQEQSMQLFEDCRQRCFVEVCIVSDENQRGKIAENFFEVFTCFDHVVVKELVKSFLPLNAFRQKYGFLLFLGELIWSSIWLRLVFANRFNLVSVVGQSLLDKVKVKLSELEGLFTTETLEIIFDLRFVIEHVRDFLAQTSLNQAANLIEDFLHLLEHVLSSSKDFSKLSSALKAFKVANDLGALSLFFKIFETCKHRIELLFNSLGGEQISHLGMDLL